MVMLLAIVRGSCGVRLDRLSPGSSDALDQRGRLLLRGGEPGYERQDERGLHGA